MIKGIKNECGKATKRANFNEKQAEFLSNSNSIRLDPTYTYYVPKQWIHEETLRTPIKNGDRTITTSNKLYVIGFDSKNQAQIITSISINTFNRMFYNPGVQVKAVLKDGVYRAAEGEPKLRFALEPNARLDTCVEGSNVYLNTPIFFKAGRTEGLQTVLKPKGKKYDMETVTVDGHKYLKLENITATVFRTNQEPISCKLEDIFDDDAMEYIID